MGDVEITWKGRIGPATLSKPEPGWATTISQAAEHETSPGRQVPSPEKQVLQDMIRGEGLRHQATHRSARDTVVRKGGVTKFQRRFGPGLARNRAAGVPSWGDSNVRFAAEGTNVKEAQIVPPPPTPTPAPGQAPMPTPVPLRPPTYGAPVTHGQYRFMNQIQGAGPEDLISMAEKRRLPVSPWAKTLNNPVTQMLVNMGAMTAVEPVLSAVGVNHPLIHMLAPWAVMSFLPDYLRKWSGIDKIKGTLMSRARAGQLGRDAAMKSPRPIRPKPIRPGIK